MLSKFADYKPRLRTPHRTEIPTFQAVTDQWWEKHSKELKPGSLKSYVPCIARAVDAFGAYRMPEVTAAQIMSMLDDMKQADFSAKVIANQHSVFNQIWDYYCSQYEVELNPSRTIRNPQHARRKKRSRPAVPQRKLLETQISSEAGGLFLGMLFYTSCRKGEALALKWSDIDLDARIIHITKNITYMGNAPVVVSTKTESGERDNPILSPFEPLLRRAKEHKRNDDYVFGGRQPLTSSRFEKMWLDLLEPLGLTDHTEGKTWKGNRKGQRHALVTPHQLRHEYAYSLYKAGVPELLAKTLMGHADISITHNIYTELGAEDVTESAELLNDYYLNRDHPSINPSMRDEK